MFLIDKYYDENIIFSYYKNILNNIINKFTHNINYKNILPHEYNNFIINVKYNKYNFNNMQHLIIYGPDGTCKEYIVNKLLEQIYGEKSIKTKDIEYTISGYSNTKTKILIKQSKYHIILEPNSNGFDKYLIQEIIKEYIKSYSLNILEQSRPYKVIVINKIDNLSCNVQASLRSLIEKYSDTCKFILISNQLTKIIEPIKSRCLLVRIPLFTDVQILEVILYISNKENIKVTLNCLNIILKTCENKINNALCLLEMYKYNMYKGLTKYVDYNILINEISDYVYTIKNITTSIKLYNIMKNLREKFYLLFITNISIYTIIKRIMMNLLNKVTDINLKYQIVSITSEYEQKINKGSRYIIQFEAYIISLIYIFYEI